MKDDKTAEQQTVVLHDGRVVSVAPERKQLIPHNVVVGVMIVLAAFIRGISSYCFIAPNNFAVGGITGIAVMLQYATGINQGVFYFLINVPILVVAFFMLPKRFSLLTIVYTVINSLSTVLIELVDNATPLTLIYTDANPALMSAVFGGVLFGVSFVMVLRVGCTQGGTDILGAIVQKKRPDMSIAWVIFALDSIVVLVSFFVYDNGLTPILLSLVVSGATSIVSDKLLKGSKSALKVEVVTNYSEEISAEIFAKVGRGVTVVDAVGMYTGNPHKLLVTVIKPRQLGEVERIIKKYPDTFSYVVQSNEVYGYWKR